MYAIIIDNEFDGIFDLPCVEDETHKNLIATSIQVENYNKYGKNYYIYDNGILTENPNYEEEQQQKEAERINNLTMTAWDFVGVLKQAGLTSTQIIDFLNSNPDIQLHLTCCQNVYCGVAKSLMPITYEGITITAAMVEKAFRDKHGV